MSALTDPPFAKDPPIKLNVNAKTLGLVYLILGALGILVDLLGLLAILGFCNSFGIYGSCGFPILWLLGDLVAFAASILFTLGAYRMYQGNPQGKEWVIYGLGLRVVAAVLTLIGNITAYSGLFGVGIGGAAIFGLIFNLIIVFILYYLVVISRFPNEAPLTPPASGAWGGGPSAPPPPPV